MKNGPIIIKNDNFTSINFRVCFLIKTKYGDSPLVRLIPNILVRISAKYPNEDEFQKEKLKRNVSSFKYYTYMFNDINLIQFDMHIADPKYVGEDKIEEAFAFLMDAIYNPKVDENKFDKKIYEKEYERLEQNIKLRNKDIEYHSYDMALKEADDLGYIKSDVFIDNTLLNNVSNEKLYAYYQKHMYNNTPLVFVLGDMEEEKIKKLYDKYVKKNKKELSLKFNNNKFLVKKDNEVKKIEEEGYFNQSALITLYKIDDITEEDKIMMFTVVSLFSSKSSNLIRKNLRDDAGLIYSSYAQAEYDSGLISIIALINGESKEQTLKQIEAAFNDIRSEEVITPLLENIVDRWRLNLLRNLDDKEATMNNVIRSILHYDFTDQQRYDKLKNIKVSDVVKFIKRMKLDLIYFQKGVKNEK